MGSPFKALALVPKALLLGDVQHDRSNGPSNRWLFSHYLNWTTSKKPWLSAIHFFSDKRLFVGGNPIHHKRSLYATGKTRIKSKVLMNWQEHVCPRNMDVCLKSSGLFLSKGKHTTKLFGELWWKEKHKPLKMSNMIFGELKIAQLFFWNLKQTISEFFPQWALFARRTFENFVVGRPPGCGPTPFALWRSVRWLDDEMSGDFGCANGDQSNGDRLKSPRMYVIYVCLYYLYIFIYYLYII